MIAQGSLSKESYLTLVMAALVQQAGGELRINPQALEAIDGNVNILIDWDVKSQQLVVRTASSSLFISSVRGNAWTSQNLPSSRDARPSLQSAVTPSSPPPESPTSRHRVRNEEEVFQYLEAKMRNEMMRQWREQGATAMEGLPPPTNGRFQG